jgi:hypothetical protein
MTSLASLQERQVAYLKSLLSAKSVTVAKLAKLAAVDPASLYKLLSGDNKLGVTVTQRLGDATGFYFDANPNNPVHADTTDVPSQTTISMDEMRQAVEQAVLELQEAGVFHTLTSAQLWAAVAKKITDKKGKDALDAFNKKEAGLLQGTPN